MSVAKVFVEVTYGTPVAIKEVTFRPPTLIEFEVVFPVLTTWSRVGIVPVIDDVVMELTRPFASIVITGVRALDPYVPGVTLVVQESLLAFPE